MIQNRYIKPHSQEAFQTSLGQIATTLFSKRNAIYLKLPFFWRRVHLTKSSRHYVEVSDPGASGKMDGLKSSYQQMGVSASESHLILRHKIFSKPFSEGVEMCLLLHVFCYTLSFPTVTNKLFTICSPFAKNTIILSLIFFCIMVIVFYPLAITQMQTKLWHRFFFFFLDSLACHYQSG